MKIEYSFPSVILSIFLRFVFEKENRVSKSLKHNCPLLLFPIERTFPFSFKIKK